MVSLFWNIISINPLKVPLITEVSTFAGLFISLFGKSSLKTPGILNCCASLSGVVGDKYEIPLRVVRHLPLISSGGLLRMRYTSVTVISPYLKDPCGFGRAAPAVTFVLYYNTVYEVSLRL